MTYYYSYRFSNGRTLIVHEDGTTDDFCEEVKVIETRKNITTGEESVTIALTGSSGFVDIFEVDRGVLDGSFMHVLTVHGLSVSNTTVYKTTVQEILFDTEKTALKVFVHDYLGFKMMNHGLEYFGAVGRIERWVSRYAKPDKVGIKGTFDTWRDGIKPLVDKKPELFLGLAMGASAPVATLLKVTNTIKETPIWGIVGESSKGKTTTLELSASVWGNPTGVGLIENFSGTEKYIYRCLSEHKGFPTFFDETSAQPSWDFTRMLYKIAMGSSGGKCAPNGTAIEPLTWSGAFTYTGEKSVLEQTNGNAGLYARLVEFDCAWTEDKNMAEQISKHIAENYGSAYLPWIEYLKPISPEEFSKKFENTVTELTDILSPKTGVEVRIIKKLAILLLTADLLSEAWGMDVNREDILLILKEAYKRNIPKNKITCQIYELVKEYVAGRKNLFPDESVRRSLSSGARQGEIGMYRGRKCLWILNGVFQKIITDKGITATSTDFKAMRDAGLIAYFGDRYIKNHKIDGITNKCICLYLDVEVEDEETAELIDEEDKAKVNASKLKFLLGEED